MKDVVIREVIDWAKYIVAAFAFALIINNTILINAEVVSGSMESTIMTDSKIVGSRLAYLTKDPQRFDVIAFKYPDNEALPPFVKRIIGLPNEKVEIKSGSVYINDSDVPLDDSFINEAAWGDYGPFVVPDNCYFVLGDNRNNSNDSKNWSNKFVAKEKILAKVLLEWYPSVRVID